MGTFSKKIRKQNAHEKLARMEHFLRFVGRVLDSQRQEIIRLRMELNMDTREQVGVAEWQKRRAVWGK